MAQRIKLSIDPSPVRTCECDRSAMSWVAGADGCRIGWFRVCRETETGAIRFDVIGNVEGLITSDPQPGVIALFMPIGLTAAGARQCDLDAREALGPRRNSVFPAPVRAALAVRNREEASTITQRIDGRRISTQAWAICPKIKEVDRVLQESADASLGCSTRPVPSLRPTRGRPNVIGAEQIPDPRLMTRSVRCRPRRPDSSR